MMDERLELIKQGYNKKQFPEVDYIHKCKICKVYCEEFVLTMEIRRNYRTFARKERQPHANRV